MIQTRFVLALAAGLGFSCAAGAHNTLQTADWCEQGTIRYTHDFTFSRNELAAEFLRRQQAASALCVVRPDPTSGGVGTCGVFDPPYEMARSMARAACGAAESTSPVPDTAVAIVVEPQSFNDANHHQDFNFDAGLSGMCGVCIPPGADLPIRDHN